MNFNLSSSESQKILLKVNRIIANFDFENIRNKVYQEKHERESDLYNILMELQDVKANIEFLYSYMKLTNNKIIFKSEDFQDEEYNDESYEHNLFDLRIFIKQIESEISIYPIENDTLEKILRTNRGKNYTKEQREQKQTLHLILKKSENYLFPKNDSAIARAVQELSGFSKKTVLGDMNEGKQFKVKIYLDAIQKLEIILKDIQDEKEKLYPNE